MALFSKIITHNVRSRGPSFWILIINIYQPIGPVDRTYRPNYQPTFAIIIGNLEMKMDVNYQ